MMAPINVRSSLWIPVLLGTALFIALGGLSVLPPSSIGWLMRGLLDPPSNLLGWEFFRETPFLQFPLGANPRYGMEMGSSIVFSDSLPLFALPFKAMGPWLPDTFQYFGLWMLLCMVMQAVFAYLTLSHFTQDKRLLTLGTLLLLLMPPYLLRFAFHLALGGQWLLLGGLYLYFAPRYRAGFWLVMLALATQIHAYLLVMLAAIWAADLLQRLAKHELNLGQCVVHGGAGSAMILLLMWLLGYFMLGPAPVAPGQYGRMNLFSLVDSRGEWSRLLPALKRPDGIEGFLDHDGFAYMGVGVLTLLALSAVLTALPRTEKRSERPYLRWPLVLMSVLMVSISLTNTLSAGPFVVTWVELPGWAERVYQVFRSPGRMIWPVFYLLAVAAIAVICVRTRPRTALLLLAVATCVQLYDLSKGLQGMRQYFQQEAGWTSPLISPMWASLGKRYQRILFAYPTHVPADFISLSDFALHHGMSINSGNFARSDLQAQARARARLAEQVASGDYDPDAIYVFNEPELWDQAIRTLKNGAIAGELDGIKLVIPDLQNCAGCRTTDFKTLRWGDWPASRLPTIIGQLREDRLVAATGASGYLSYGPYTRIPAGRYRYRITYAASGESSLRLGTWDIVSNATQSAAVLAQGELTGTGGKERTIEGLIERDQDTLDCEIRTLSNGNGELSLIRIQLQPEGTDHSLAQIQSTQKTP
ncbi:DUF6311 domain-containing protein [Pseudomonas multiresinivorans]|uniref:YfhO family protein n=1 Tax=Pseudomonas multiresinivorans TaxID=95301 RepID=A0A7Z3GNK2_9PSED|nr:DUF6311 domain-containing protein [Pseudomonas multiresinivorans]QJP06769.1 hypothetical protein G4G71_02330 [Pseudomonas multiresinivorans]